MNRVLADYDGHLRVCDVINVFECNGQEYHLLLADGHKEPIVVGSVGCTPVPKTQWVDVTEQCEIERTDLCRGRHAGYRIVHRTSLLPIGIPVHDNPAYRFLFDVKCQFRVWHNSAKKE